MKNKSQILNLKSDMLLSQYLFFFLSFVAVLSALMVILDKNPVHSVLYLVITFFAIAAHYLILNAQFLAVVHIIVYAGAIMVLFLYVIMMLNLNKDIEPHKKNIPKIAAVISAGVLMMALVALLKDAEVSMLPAARNSNIGLIDSLGKVLFREYMLPFEISSILFLSAMVGAVLLSKKEISGSTNTINLLSDSFSFEGRIGRLEYAISVLIYIISHMLFYSYINKSYIILILLLIPSVWFFLAQSSKRSHDIGNSGWYLLIPFYIFILLFKKGQSEKNEYGIKAKTF